MNYYPLFKLGHETMVCAVSLSIFLFFFKWKKKYFPLCKVLTQVQLFIKGEVISLTKFKNNVQVLNASYLRKRPWKYAKLVFIYTHVYLRVNLCIVAWITNSNKYFSNRDWSAFQITTNTYTCTNFKIDLMSCMNMYFVSNWLCKLTNTAFILSQRFLI